MTLALTSLALEPAQRLAFVPSQKPDSGLNVPALLNKREDWLTSRFPVSDWSPVGAVYSYGDAPSLYHQSERYKAQVMANPALGFLKDQHSQGNTGKGVVFFIDEGPSDHRLATSSIPLAMLPDAKVRLIDSEAGGSQMRGSRFDEIYSELKSDRGDFASTNLRDRTKAQLLAYLRDKIEVVDSAASEGAQYISSSSVLMYDSLLPASKNPQVAKELNAVMRQAGAVTPDQRAVAWANYVRELASTDPDVQRQIRLIQQKLSDGGIVYAEGAGNFSNQASSERSKPSGAQGTLLSELVPQVFTVGATDRQTGGAARYSSQNTGIDLREQPGIDDEGTSYATPAALAEVALLVGASARAGKKITPQQAVELLKSSADKSMNSDPLKDGAGDAHFERALELLKKPRMPG
ncbi:MAG: S8/S53 family peptidase [Rhizobacter sp.]